MNILLKVSNIKTIVSEHGAMKASIKSEDGELNTSFVIMDLDKTKVIMLDVDRLSDLIACLQEIKEAVSKEGK